jgi:hypothetical protein
VSRMGYHHPFKESQFPVNWHKIWLLCPLALTPFAKLWSLSRPNLGSRNLIDPTSATQTAPFR